MYRLFLFSVIYYLTTLAMNAAVSAFSVPSIYLEKYGIHDYYAGSQNWDLFVSPDGILYVGNNSGLLTFDGNNWINYELPDKSAVFRIKWLNDTVYIQSETSVGYWFPDGMGWLNYHPLDTLPACAGLADPPESLPSGLPGEIRRILLHFSTLRLQNNVLHALCVQDSFNLWAAFDDGLIRICYHPALRLLATCDDIGMMLDMAIHDDVLYISTDMDYYKCKLSLPEDKFTPVTEKEALLYLSPTTQEEELNIDDILGESIGNPEFSDMESLYPISDKCYWLTGENEALLISGKENRLEIEYRILFDNYHLNLVKKGKQIVSFNDSLHIVLTIQGVLLLNTNRLPENLGDKGLPFHFIRMQYKDSRGVHVLNPRSEKIHLPHDFHELMIYAGSSVFDPNTPISYKIENVSPDWSDWQSDGKISFLQLPENEYELSVRKYTGQGDFPTIRLSIHVCSPWYATIWAYLCYILLLAGIIGINIRNCLKKQKRKKAYLLSLERQKTQQFKNEMLEAELENKKNELVKQTAILSRKSAIMNTLLEELEHQKDILGDRYPHNLYMRMRSLMEKVLNNQGDWIAFETYFNSAHQNFIERFRQQYTDITTGDLRMCCLLRMNLSTKEIASILHVSVRAVELRRYRLRKRIGLDSDTNLVDFLISF
jgi:DNA-binding CsgD family transcriptional regulator